LKVPFEPSPRGIWQAICAGRSATSNFWILLAALSPAKREQNLDNPDYLPESWFEGLMNAPLIRRPVVVQMLAEWLPQKGGEQTAGVYRVFDHLVRRHLAMVLPLSTKTNVYALVSNTYTTRPHIPPQCLCKMR